MGVLGTLLTAPSAADPESNEIERWVPSLALESGLVGQDVSGVQQNSLRPPAEPGEPGPGTPSSDDGQLLDPFVGVSAELMTPVLADWPGRPRLFLRAGGDAVFGSRVSVAREASPGPFEVPPSSPGLPIPAGAVGGQGTRTDVRIEPGSFSAGAGIAFTADVLGRRLRLKPSLEYLLYRVEASGVMRNVEGSRLTDAMGQIVEDFEFTTLRSDENETVHAFGGGLELELDSVRMRSFVIAPFVAGRYHRVLSDRSLRLRAESNGDTASWRVDLDRDAFQALVGLRFRYIP